VRLSFARGFVLPEGAGMRYIGALTGTDAAGCIRSNADDELRAEMPLVYPGIVFRVGMAVAQALRPFREALPRLRCQEKSAFYVRKGGRFSIP